MGNRWESTVKNIKALTRTIVLVNLTVRGRRTAITLCLFTLPSSRQTDSGIARLGVPRTSRPPKIFSTQNLAKSIQTPMSCTSSQPTEESEPKTEKVKSKKIFIVFSPYIYKLHER